MRRIATIVITAAAALAVPASADGWYSPHRPALACANRHGAPVAHVHPGTCNTWFSWLAHYQTSGFLKKLRWHHWGTHTATARGRMLYNTGNLAVRVRAYRVRCIASYRVREGCAYTRLYVHTGVGHGVQKMPWGYDLWPDY